MRDVQPPGEQPRERTLRGGRDRARRVVADHGDADRARVEPLRVGADHVPVDSARPALEDVAEPVDEEVVADVVPAVSAHVVELDRAHDRGRVLGACSRSSRRCDGRPRTRRSSAYCGGVRTIRSFAFQPERGTIRGEPTIETVRSVVRSTGLRTYHACKRRTVAEDPVVEAVGGADPVRDCRAASRAALAPPRCPGPAGPPPRARPAATRSSGRSCSACGTAPSPSPASGVRPGRTCRRADPGRRSRACRAAGSARRSSPFPAQAPAGDTSRQKTTSRSSLVTGGPGQVCLGRQGIRHPADRILTTVKAAFLRALLASVAVGATFLIAVGPASAAPPRVLAVSFDADVNPVTAGYLTHQIDRANRDGYDAAVIVLDTPGGPLGVDAEDLQEGARARRSR